MLCYFIFPFKYNKCNAYCSGYLRFKSLWICVMNVLCNNYYGVKVRFSMTSEGFIIVKVGRIAWKVWYEGFTRSVTQDGKFFPKLNNPDGSSSEEEEHTECLMSSHRTFLFVVDKFVVLVLAFTCVRSPIQQTHLQRKFCVFRINGLMHLLGLTYWCTSMKRRASFYNYHQLNWYNRENVTRIMK